MGLTNDLFKMFTGEFVSVTLKVYLMEAKDTEQENYSFQVPMTKEGYLIEEDKYSYYFGPEPDNITFAIKKKDISIMEISSNNQFEDLLNNMESKKPEDMN